MAVSIFLMILTGSVCFYMYTLCSQGHQEVPHTQDITIIKDEVTRLEQGTVHQANRRLLGITHENTRNSSSQFIPVRIQQMPSSSSSEGSTNTIPVLPKVHCITSEDSKKAVKILPVNIPQKLSRYYQ